MCIEPVVAGTQSCQNLLAGPVKKVICILLLSGFQRCFDDGGLFLVMDAGWLMVALLVLSIWLADLLACLQRFCSVLGSIGDYSACVAEFLHLCY